MEYFFRNYGPAIPQGCYSTQQPLQPEAPIAMQRSNCLSGGLFDEFPQQFLPMQFGGLLMPGWTNSGRPNFAGQRKNINTTLVETGGVDSNGEGDAHAQCVEDIVKTGYPEGSVNIMGLDDPNAPPDPDANKFIDLYSNVTTSDGLNRLIDTSSTDMLDKMSKQIKNITEQGKTNVINASFSFCRDDVYHKVMRALMENPSLSSVVGLKSDDTAKIVYDDNGEIQFPQNVAEAVAKYVNNELDTPDSAFQKSLSGYQDATQQAAHKGIITVVAAGNNRKDNTPFGAKGGDTNFLAESPYVVSVAASQKADNDPNARQIADFSSWGDGQYNPTVSANGVNVATKLGPQNGTSFAAPEVSATVAQMLKANPNLTFQQVKSILRNTATDVVHDSTISDGAGDVNSTQAISEARAWNEPFSPSLDFFTQFKLKMFQLFSRFNHFNTPYRSA